MTGSATLADRQYLFCGFPEPALSKGPGFPEKEFPPLAKPPHILGDVELDSAWELGSSCQLDPRSSVYT